MTENHSNLIDAIVAGDPDIVANLEKAVHAKFADGSFDRYHEDPAVRASHARLCELDDALKEITRLGEPLKTATVALYRSSGKYYTEEQWRIPEGAIGPYDMTKSPDYRLIDDGYAVVQSQEPWGYPCLLKKY